MDEIKNGENNFTTKNRKAKAARRIKKIWNWFTTALTIVLVGMAIYCAFGIKNQNKTGELFFPMGYRGVKILSGSMEDTLRTGSMVIVKETKDVEEGDIIFFITEDRIPVIHRYIDTDDDGNMITKGDNNPKEDLEPVTSQRLFGKVVKTMNWTAEPLNFISWMLNKIR